MSCDIHSAHDICFLSDFRFSRHFHFTYEKLTISSLGMKLKKKRIFYQYVSLTCVISIALSSKNTRTHREPGRCRWSYPGTLGSINNTIDRQQNWYIFGTEYKELAQYERHTCRLNAVLHSGFLWWVKARFIGRKQFFFRSKCKLKKGNPWSKGHHQKKMLIDQFKLNFVSYA